MYKYNQRNNELPISDEERATFVEYPDVERPKTRADCIDVPRPCPFVTCRHNNYLNVTESGTIQYAYPDRAPEDVPAGDSCSLDVSDRGQDPDEPMDLIVIGGIIGRSKEAVRITVESAQRNARVNAKCLADPLGLLYQHTQTVDNELERTEREDSRSELEVDSSSGKVG